jgi:WD40 repeat protein
VFDPAFLREATPEQLYDVLGDAVDTADPALRAYRRVLHRLLTAAPDERAGLLQAMALTEQTSVVDALELTQAAGWSPIWASGEKSAFHLSLIGHTGPVTALAFGTVAGRTVPAGGGADGTVRLWDAYHGRPLATLEGHTAKVLALAFRAGGDRAVVASGSRDGTVRLRDAGGGTTSVTVTLPQGWPTSVVFMPVAGREVLVTGSITTRGYGGLDLWHPDTGEHLDRLDDDGPVCGLGVVPYDGRTLLAAIGTGDDDSTSAVRLWDPATWTQEAIWEWQNTSGDHNADAATFVTPLAVDSTEGRVRLGAAAAHDCASHDHNRFCSTMIWWDLLSGAEFARRSFEWNETLVASSDRDGHDRLATAMYYRNPWSGDTEGPEVRVQRLSGRRMAALRGHTEAVGIGAFGEVAGTTVLATAGRDATVMLWDADTETSMWNWQPGPGLAVAADPVRPVLATCSPYDDVQLRHPVTGDRQAARADEIGVWDLATGEPRSTIASPDGTVTCLALAMAGATCWSPARATVRSGSGTSPPADG